MRFPEWIRKIATGWSVPGWVVLLFWLLLRSLDWSDRLDSAKSKIGKMMPTLRPFIDFIVTPQGQILTLVLGLVLLFIATWKKLDRTPILSEEKQRELQEHKTRALFPPIPDGFGRN